MLRHRLEAIRASLDSSLSSDDIRNQMRMDCMSLKAEITDDDISSRRARLSRFDQTTRPRRSATVFRHRNTVTAVPFIQEEELIPMGGARHDYNSGGTDEDNEAPQLDAISELVFKWTTLDEFDGKKRSTT